MKRRRLPALALFLCFFSTTYASPHSAWEDYDQLLSRYCPGRHVGWLADGAWDQFFARFEETLTPAQRNAIRAQSEVERRCADEQFGFYCERSWMLEAYKTVKVLKNFASYSCRHVRCTEPALCSG